MECVGLRWKGKKCAVAHVKKGTLELDAGSIKIDELKPFSNLKENTTYKFLGVLENIKREDKLVLEGACKVYLQRSSII